MKLQTLNNRSLALSATLETLYSEMESLLDQIQEWYDERSEKWLESEACELWDSRISELESARDSVYDAINNLEELRNIS